MIDVVDGIKIENHCNELERAEEFIDELKYEYRKHERLQTIDEKEYVHLYQETIRVLYYIGDLSMTAFNVEKQLEEKYLLMYAHSPELGKQLYFNKYHEIHKPYNLLKNRCYTLLDQLDDLFTQIHSRSPVEFENEFIG